jgi:predicted PurR-regulated permease PerM
MESHAPESSTFRSAYQLLVMMACAVIIIFGLKYAAQIITPILLAFVLSNIFLPLQSFMISKGVKRWLALTIVLVIMLLVMGALVSITVASITQFINRIPTYENDLQNTINAIYNWLLSLPIDTSNMLSLPNLDVSQIFSLSVNVLSTALDALSNWVIVIILIGFMLADFANLDERLQAAFKNSDQIKDVIEMTDSLRSYVSLTTYIGILVGIGNAVFLLIMGVDFAILWGLLGFLMNYIPNVGIIVSMVPPAVLAFLAFGWQEAVIVIIGFWLINMVVENFVKPSVMGEDLNISPLFIMLSLVLWSFVLGPMGTILAIPMTLIVSQLILKRSEETQWLAVLMSSQPNPHRKQPVRKLRSTIKGWFQRTTKKKED